MNLKPHTPTPDAIPCTAVEREFWYTASTSNNFSVQVSALSHPGWPVTGCLARKKSHPPRTLQ